MNTTSGRVAAAAIAVAALLIACVGDSPANKVAQAEASPVLQSPTPSASKRTLCQPFPDRLADEFIAAYNGRDLSALQELVPATDIRDVVAAGYARTASTFTDVDEWTDATWDANDRIKLSGYSAFAPTKWGFQMHMTRGSDALRDAGIERIATTMDAITHGCHITSLVDSGPIQAREHPCAFYDAFRSVADVASRQPRACMDGSAEEARSAPAAVSTGEEVLIWGGDRGGLFAYPDLVNDGLSFSPSSDRWDRVPANRLPASRPSVAAWTGTELIVIGNKSARDYGVVAAAYRPTTHSWREIDFTYKRWSGFEGVWTGSELILWGGPDHSRRPHRRGAIFDPVSGTWRRTSPAPIGGRWSHAATWTGSEMMVWGGGDADSDLGDGAAYDPATDSWREIAPAPLAARQWMPITWTGSEVIVWGGSSYSTSKRDGAAYDPASDSWRQLPRSPLKSRHYHSATWTGEELIVFGGYNYDRSFADGAAYNPTSNAWRKLPRAPIKPRFNHAAVWSSSEMVVFGGTWDFGHIALGDGAVYDPRRNRWRRIVPNLRE
ncbi:MAG TPA: kelch repeat-containing protein [Actinomycetota bacterium]|nr:kelch repeat-containing protein [Actinomycetota bacterium]